MRKWLRFVIYGLFVLGILFSPLIGKWVTELLGWYASNVWSCGIFAAVVAAVALVAFIEIMYSQRTVGGCDSNICKYEVKEVEPFNYDTPNNLDIYRREWQAKLLLDKIFETFYDQCIKKRARNYRTVDGSFVIHIGENYGVGKTSFLMLLEDAIEESGRECLKFDFRPWLCGNTAAIVKEFFIELRDCLNEAGLAEMEDTIREYAKALLSSMAIGSSGISMNIDGLTSKPHSLRALHDKIRIGLMRLDRPMIITIDDVDRLDADETMMVMKIIRDTADFPKIFYIVAADNARLEEVLEENGIRDVDTYLKKFFNVELQMPANDNVAFKELVKLLRKKYEKIGYKGWKLQTIVQSIENIKNIKQIFGDMREVYRFLNVYFMHLDMMNYKAKDNKERRNGVDDGGIELGLSNLFRLCLIKFLDPEYYVLLRDHFDLIFDTYRVGNDYALKWKDELNISLQRRQKVSGADNKKDVVEPSSEESTDNVVLDRHETVKYLMNEMFQEKKTLLKNDICRVNIYYKYFAFEQADYMVSRLEVMKMLGMKIDKYTKELDKIFKKKREKMFLAEFTYLAQDNKRNRADLLIRYILFIRLAYAYKRWMEGRSNDIGFSNYLNGKEIPVQMGRIANALYGGRSESRGKSGEDTIKDLLNLCESYDGINILLKLLDVIERKMNIGNIFKKDEINTMREELIDRLWNEKVLPADGWLDDDMLSTMIVIKDNDYWIEKLKEYLYSSEEIFLNFICCLIGKIKSTDAYHYVDNIRQVIQSLYKKNNDLYDEFKKHYHGIDSIINDMKTIVESENVFLLNNDPSRPFVDFAIKRRKEHLEAKTQEQKDGGAN